MAWPIHQSNKANSLMLTQMQTVNRKELGEERS